MDKILKTDDVCIKEEQTILQALEKLNRCGTQILFVVHGIKLVACVTDGDIRKALLMGKQLTTKISEVCNYHPIVVRENERQKAKKLIEEESLQAIPVVNKDNEIITIIFRTAKCKLNVLGSLNIPIAIMAGGKGTRLLPYTKVLPKPLLPIADIPISERIIQKFREYGCQEFYMIVNYKKEMIKAYYKEIVKDYNLTFIDENIPLGTGGGLKLLKNLINRTFILTNCDILIEDDISRAYEYHKKQNNIATMICSLKNYEIPYGVVEIDDSGDITEMKEKPNISFLANTGCYILEPEIINHISLDTEIGMPQILDNLKNIGKKVGAYPISESAWLDMGQLDGFKTMTQRFENQI